MVSPIDLKIFDAACAYLLENSERAISPSALQVTNLKAAGAITSSNQGFVIEPKSFAEYGKRKITGYQAVREGLEAYIRQWPAKSHAVPSTEFSKRFNASDYLTFQLLHLFQEEGLIKRLEDSQDNKAIAYIYELA